MHQLPKPILEKFFSNSRLARYKELAGENADFISVYRLNTQESAKFFTALIQFEVVLRNAINEQLREDFGVSWLNEVMFNAKQQEMIGDVRLRLFEKKKEINNCNIISNLSFGFWVNLFSSDYDKTLWRNSLYKVFYNTDARPSRSKVRERLEKFLILRNRISHCECIIHFPLQKYRQQLIEIISWINQDIARWFDEEI